MNISRRGFAGKLVSAGAAILVSPTLADYSPGQDSLAHLVVGLFRHSASAARVGELYLEQRPYERGVNVLLERLLGQHWGLLSGRPDMIRLQAILAHRHRLDFGCARVAELNGWILSDTEARVCALSALLEQPNGPPEQQMSGDGTLVDDGILTPVRHRHL